MCSCAGVPGQCCMSSHSHVCCAPWLDTRVLAHALDSLVRVSRRVVCQLFTTNPIRTAAASAANRFLSSNFTYYLTLFSKSFSSFPHGTCSLSVSCLYLAFDGVYHPLGCCPKQPDSPDASLGLGAPHGILTLYDVLFQRTFAAPAPENATTTLFPDSKSELFPVHSPLLGKSLLVSFPPLTDMLKFSGSSYLI